MNIDSIMKYLKFSYSKFKVMLFVLIIFSITACSSSSDARKVLSNSGYINIKTNGFSLFGCAKDDTFSTKFTATNSQGKRVSGVVCSGWLKGGTIRF